MATQTFVGCAGVGLLGTPTVVCDAEKNALQECTRNNNPWENINGARATCTYSTSGTLGGCEVACSLGNHHFGMQCGGPAGLPVRCGCWVNGIALGDLDWETSTFYASDCSDAAHRIADGEWCINRLDCCLEWTEGNMKRCQCGSDRGCARTAEQYKATVVETCPKYELGP